MLLLMLASLVLCDAAQAESATASGTGGRAAARLDLFVRIPEILRLRTPDPAVQELTEADIQRGWVDTTLQLEITSNSRSGFQLALRTDPRWVQAAEIDGLGLPLHTQGGAAYVRLSHHGAPEKQRGYALRMRLMLKPGLQPGRYATPVAVSLSA